MVCDKVVCESWCDKDGVKDGVWLTKLKWCVKYGVCDKVVWKMVN